MTQTNIFTLEGHPVRFGNMIALMCTNRGFPEFRDIGETISLWLQQFTPADAFSTVEGETKGSIVKVTVEVISADKN